MAETTYMPRSEWTSIHASGRTLTGVQLVGVAVHWPGTSQNVIGTSGIESRLRGYRDYHVDTNGWRDIGYNLAIDQAGRVWMLRSTSWHGDMVGAHAASGSNSDANREYVGVLLVLGDEEPPSPEMIAAFRDWYHNHFLAAWPERTDVRGHRQVPGAQTTCPGDYVIAVLDELTKEGDTMSWDETLEPTDLAAGRFNDDYSTRADHALMHTLGLAYHANFGDIDFNGWMADRWGDHAHSPRAYLRSGYGHARAARENTEQLVAKQERLAADMAAKFAALQDTVQQLAEVVGSPVDMERVSQAARDGANAAIAELDAEVTLQLSPAADEDDDG